MKIISVRINDEVMEKRLKELGEEHHLSDNMLVKMLIGYAFSRIDREGAKFKPMIVFSEDVE